MSSEKNLPVLPEQQPDYFPAKNFLPVMNRDLVGKAKAAVNATVDAHRAGQTARAVGGLAELLQSSDKLARATLHNDVGSQNYVAADSTGAVVSLKRIATDIADDGRSTQVKRTYLPTITDPKTGQVSNYAPIFLMSDPAYPSHTPESSLQSFFNWLGEKYDAAKEYLTPSTDSDKKRATGTRFGSTQQLGMSVKPTVSSPHAIDYPADASMSEVYAALSKNRQSRLDDLQSLRIPESVSQKFLKSFSLVRHGAKRISQQPDGSVMINLRGCPFIIREEVYHLLSTQDYDKLSNTVALVARLLDALDGLYMLSVRSLPHGSMSKQSFDSLTKAFPGLFVTDEYKNSRVILAAPGRAAEIAAQSAQITLFLTNNTNHRMVQ